MTRFLTLLFIIHSSLFINHCAAQFSPKEQRQLDSLNAILNNKNSHDTARASAYVGLSEILYVSNLDTLTPLCVKAQQIAILVLKNNPNKTVRKSILRSLSTALNNIGYKLENEGHTHEALDYYCESLKITEEVGDKKEVANSLNNIGFIHKKQGQLKEALIYYNKSLQIREIIGDKKGIAESFNNICSIYHSQGQEEEALIYLNKSLKIREEIGDKKGVAGSLNNIGVLHKGRGDYKKALDCFSRSLKIREEIGDKQGVATSFNNIASMYESQGLQKEALLFSFKSLNIREEIGDKIGIASSLKNIGDIFNSQGKTQKALEYATKSLELFQEVGYPDKIGSSAELLYQIYEKQGEGMKALEMHKLYIEMRDSINNMETQKAAIKNQMQYEYEKEQAATKAEQDKKDLLVKEEKEKQQIVLYATGGGLALVSVFLFLLFNRFKTTQRQKSIIEKQKHLVDEKQKEILDSIRYAKRIQDAILPSLPAMQQALKNGFVLYKPKDVVAGDFYWMESTSVAEVVTEPSRSTLEAPEAPSIKKPIISSGVEVPGLGQSFGSLPSGEDLGGAIFFAAADCTGHGVPGAMMSVVCSNALSKALLEEKAQTTGELLDKTRNLVIDRLAKSGEEVKDGMDISLCSLTLPSLGGVGGGLLQWSGANNPLWIVCPNRTPSLPSRPPTGQVGQAGGAEVHGVHSVAEALEAPGVVEADLVPSGIPAPLDDQSGQNSSTSLFTTHYSLIEFKPDKQPIGMFSDAKPFTTHHIELQKGDTIYIFTDGYQDQFGGDKSKKYKASKLKELLLSIQHEPMDTQKEILNNEFETWKGTLEQVDDVCLIGVKI